MQENVDEQIVEDCQIVNIKIENKQRIISDYSFDGTDKLNKNLSEYIMDKTKRLNFNKKLKLRFYSPSEIDQKEAKDTIKNHFYDEYLEEKEKLKKSNCYMILMLVLGIITISILFIGLKFFRNFYFETILEIAAWLFIWEFMGELFFKIPKIKAKCNQFKSLYTATVETINYNENKEEDNAKE